MSIYTYVHRHIQIQICMYVCPVYIYIYTCILHVSVQEGADVSFCRRHAPRVAECGFRVEIHLSLRHVLVCPKLFVMTV